MSYEKAIETGKVTVGVEDDPDFVIISLTRAFCQNGHPLIAAGAPTFYGLPGLRVQVRQNETVGMVTLSAVHGDQRRVGGDDFEKGQPCQVCCPTCGDELPAWEDGCRCGGGKLRVVFLSPDCDPGNVALICDVWGCHRSRVVDKWELLSEYVDEDDQ